LPDPLRDQLQSSLGTAYTLERELGGGGMSRVFVADETRLGRKVVVKVLAPELAAGLSAARFEQEIRLVAGLQQANIVPLLSAGETEGLPYYTMPFVDGLSLRARLARNGAMPVAEAVSVLRDVARALAYAHEHGVVHRDIKPENVLLSGDAAVVTDFGIAKALSASRTKAPGGTLTQVGTSLGTPAYMAPEQGAGDPATDHRADLYALGCLAYEMLLGEAPFAGRPVHQLFAAHLNEVPAPLGDKRADVPRTLAELVARCLEKDPARRPQSAREVLQALDTVTTGPPGMLATSRRGWVIAASTSVLVLVLAVAAGALFRTRAMSGRAADDVSAVAVLPFVNASGDTASNYFADGMTDELATALAKVPGLRVASRMSSYAFRTHDGLDAPAIASRLRVGAIIEGTVRRAGTQLRVTAQLTRGSDGQSLWADAFTADAGDVFAVQARLTQAIVAAVAPAITGQSPTAVTASATAGTRDVAAYDAYLRARYELNRRGLGVRRSIRLFQQAVTRDPSFASAWAGLASAWAVLPYYEAGSTSSTGLDSARVAAGRAMALDSLVGESYTALGYALAETGALERGAQLMERGVALDPRSAVARLWLAFAYRQMGRFALEERVEREAIALDPMAGIVITNLAQTVTRDPARLEEARSLARRGVAVDPENSGTLNNAAGVLVVTGDAMEALELNRRGRVLGGDPQSAATAVMMFVALGMRDSALASMTTLEREPRSPKVLEALATGAAALGRWDEAFAYAGKAVAVNRSMIFVFDAAPAWQPAAGDPRLRALCSRTAMNCDEVIRIVARTKPLR
jgi:serine/threonine-protein kinase